MKKTQALKAMSEKERTQHLQELKKELMQARSQIATGTTPKNPVRIKAIKRTIARIITLTHINKEEHHQ